nr:MAG TPA: Helix-turn-helix XRE-family like protein [Caudoviricetes sp.]
MIVQLSVFVKHFCTEIRIILERSIMGKSAYERYCEIRNKLNYKDSDVAKGAKITKSTFSDWKAGRYTPKQEKMQKIADFLGVTVDYIMTGNESIEPQKTIITPKDERDIAKTVNDLMGKLESNDGAPLFFDGTEMSTETRILFEQQLKSLVTTVKEINKVKFNPNKNKK